MRMIIGRTRWGSAVVATAVLVGLAMVSGCQNDRPAPGPSPSPERPSVTTRPGPSPAPSRSPSSPLPPEPTTTNTLPPPKAPTSPAPKTAGKLTAKDLPVPKGWRTVAREGGAEEGYLGNGTWTHARDPRYAAQDVITIGCASITRDDYPDPVAALEGTYGRQGAVNSQPGVGEVMQFKSAADATAYYREYRDQVRACSDPDGQVYAKIIGSDEGLIDRRVYDGSSDWTEVGKLTGNRLTLIILTDPGHRITKSQAEAILAKIDR
ncbi:hypothetical protein [Microlunatus sp. Gsoil 973]|uniref:hypothetical protein n=1 Tax=Microlunatus sp. Gsoil 973 TaxID=2672569 RepID=UPI0012B4D6C3|nr:hypothetical protein [Microlunatus sp. Gsoil 973]QGN34555.1 hypothetical protein GJV80_18950 [Microlunatus sp. Gsoil 973]